MFIATELYSTFWWLETENWCFEIGDLVGDFTKKLVTRMDGAPKWVVFFTWNSQTWVPFSTKIYLNLGHFFEIFQNFWVFALKFWKISLDFEENPLKWVYILQEIPNMGTLFLKIYSERWVRGSGSRLHIPIQKKPKYPPPRQGIRYFQSGICHIFAILITEKENNWWFYNKMKLLLLFYQQCYKWGWADLFSGVVVNYSQDFLLTWVDDLLGRQKLRYLIRPSV